jgi:flagellum-specific peptidoglycan hydrolase FlgJ
MKHPFFDELIPYAQEMQRRTGIPASVALAQAALESGFGKSLLSKQAKNLFGVKAGSSW